MKNGWKIVLMITSSVILLTACNADKTELPNETAIQSSLSATSDLEKNEIIDIDEEFNVEWLLGRFYRAILTPSYWITFKNTDSGLVISVPGYSFDPGKAEIINSEEYGTSLRYTYTDDDGRFDFIVDYMIENDTVIVLYTNYTYQSSGAADYSGVYEYDADLSNAMSSSESSSQQSKSIGFFDGQQFECFETISGEDIILTIYVFDSADSNTPLYKGELSNGMEFWLEYEGNSTSYEDSVPKDWIVYRTECSDGTTARLQYSSSTSEIVFTADEGTEYGNMYAYSGTYIGLPDEEEN